MGNWRARLLASRENGVRHKSRQTGFWQQSPVEEQILRFIRSADSERQSESRDFHALGDEFGRPPVLIGRTNDHLDGLLFERRQDLREIAA